MLERRALAIALLFFGVASIYRVFHFATTGFFVPDEYGYALSAWRSDFFYQGRNFFNLVNISFFQLFNIGSVDRLVVMMPLYFMLWVSIAMLAAYRACKMLRFGEKAVSATLILSLTIPVFALFSVSFLTESVSVAMAMVGIFLTTKFAESGLSRQRYLYPFGAALCFAAAAYTRIDFTLYQMAGFVPFLYTEARRLRNSDALRRDSLRALVVILLFVVPAVFFLYYPQRTGSSVVEAVGSVSGPPPPTAGSVIPPQAHFLFNTLANTFYIFSVGLLVGYTPIYAIVIVVPFLILAYTTIRSRAQQWFVNFWLALLGLGAFFGTAYFFSNVGSFPLSTIIRYSYDMVPAFFILAPVFFMRLKGRRGYSLIVVGLLVYGGVVATSYQSYLQSNLGYAYPFASGSDPLLTPQYRTPYAQIRDYFAQLPENPRVVVIGEARTTYGGDKNSLPQDWRFTPGVARLTNVAIFPYVSRSGLANIHPSVFYLYIEKGGNNYFNATSDYLLGIRNGTYASAQANWPFKVTGIEVVFDTYSFYLARVTLSY